MFRYPKTPQDVQGQKGCLEPGTIRLGLMLGYLKIPQDLPGQKGCLADYYVGRY